jgi:GNAT superfamily N-acetyltransferase
MEIHDYGIAQYSVKDINGYYIHFAGTPVEKGMGGTGHSEGFAMRISERKPSVEEYRRLQAGFGSVHESVEIAEKILSTAAYGVVAEDVVSGDIVGCAFVLSDLVDFYYVKNVMVHPDWQGRGVGTALMKTLMKWVESHVEGTALVGLFARQALEPFYQRFGFLSTFGMIKEIIQ